jgi:hypothetical protein
MPPPPPAGGRVGAQQASAADNEETMMPVKFSGEQKTIATVVVTKASILAIPSHPMLPL